MTNYGCAVGDGVETELRRAELRVWYAGLWPKLALAVRERGVSSSQAVAFDRAMRELFDFLPSTVGR
jgi:hypothetical protein